MATNHQAEHTKKGEEKILDTLSLSILRKNKIKSSDYSCIRE